MNSSFFFTPSTTEQVSLASLEVYRSISTRASRRIATCSITARLLTYLAGARGLPGEWAAIRRSRRRWRPR